MALEFSLLIPDFLNSGEEVRSSVYIFLVLLTTDVSSWPNV